MLDLNAKGHPVLGNRKGPGTEEGLSSSPLSQDVSHAAHAIVTPESYSEKVQRPAALEGFTYSLLALPCKSAYSPGA